MRALPVLVVVLLAGCSARTEKDKPDAVMTIDDLLNRLEDGGVRIEACVAGKDNGYTVLSKQGTFWAIVYPSEKAAMTQSSSTFRWHNIAINTLLPDDARSLKRALR